MRIIAGTARGRQVFSVSKKMPVRPISSRIKQSVFDILRPKITASKFLDLFSGTGAVGLEALSRGAMLAVFAEKEPACLNVINRNLEHLGFKDRAIVAKANILAGVGWLNHHSGGEGYDIIFMSPPYKDANGKPLFFSETVVKSIGETGILAPDGILVVQHHENEHFAVPRQLEVYREETYGDTTVTFMKRAGGTSAG